jgi:predicted nuclease of predicted toxin-antitoxin system
MRVLLDECVPRRMRQELPGHTVKTVVEMGWAGVKNGALLQLATANFDCFVTVDRNLQFQQNVAGLKIGVVILHASGNEYETLRPLMPRVRSALDRLTHGQVVDVGD